VHILYGLGGCGKTEIAWEVSQTALSWGIRTWWIHAGGQASVGAGMREVAIELGAPPALVKEAWDGRASATDLVWQMLNGTSAPWLLVLDNADWPEHLADRDRRRIADGVGWLRQPRTPHGMIIVTSRVGESSVWGTWPVRHRVGALEPEDGAKILLDYAEKTESASAEEVFRAADLSRRLGGLPLALQAAGAYLRKVNDGPVFRKGNPARTIREYHEKLIHRFDEVSPHINQHKLTDELDLAAVYSTCEMSLSLLDKQNLADARFLLGVLAFMAARPIPWGAVLNHEVMSASPLFGSLSESRIRLLVDALDSLTLINRGTNESAGRTYGHTLTLHPLVRDVVLESQDERHARELRRLMIDLLDDTARDLDPDDPDSWTGWAVIAPHCAGPVLDYVRWCENEGHLDDPRISVSFAVVRKVSRFLLARSLPRQAQLFIEDCLRSLPPVWRTRSDVVAVRHEYGRCLLEQGRLEEAEVELTFVLVQRTLDVDLGSQHPDTFATRHKLARCMLEQRQWESAEANLREILLYERSRDANGVDTLTVWHSLVRAVLGQGRLDEASREISGVLEAWRSRSHPHPESLYARITAARIMYRKRAFENALAETTDLLDEYTSKDWSMRAEVTQARRLRGECLCSVARVEEGVAELQSVLLWQDTNLGSEHAETIATKESLNKWCRD
jgi:tetratricopeptide (TPR) repeat protein